MYLHELTAPAGSHKRRKIVGRGKGSGHGKTSCRGHGRNQHARSGRGILGSLEGGQMPLIRRLPKVGFRSHRPILYQVVQLESLNRFKNGTVVDAQALKTHGLVANIFRPFKVLGNGEIKHALTIQAYSFSKAATEKIAQAGGKAVVIDAQTVKKETTSAVADSAIKKVRAVPAAAKNKK